MEDEELEPLPMTRRRLLAMLAAVAGAMFTLMILSTYMGRAVTALFPTQRFGHYIALALNVALATAVYTLIMRLLGGPVK